MHRKPIGDKMDMVALFKHYNISQSLVNGGGWSKEKTDSDNKGTKKTYARDSSPCEPVETNSHHQSKHTQVKPLVE